MKSNCKTEEITVLNSAFSSLFTSGTADLTLPSFLICIASALVLGAVTTLVYMYKSSYTRSFAVTLATLPAIVCVVIMMVSGSLGAGIAVAGTFSLVRFRSVAGTAREIGAVFLAMAIGLACGMGCPAFAAIFAVIMCVVNLLYTALNFGAPKQIALRKTLQITVPEDLNYGTIFDDLFARYTEKWELTKVKTAALGSLNKLTYDIALRDGVSEKEFVDELRCRNGNLEVSLSIQRTDAPEL